ncbi:helix-turn-helix transcriptional regulator [Anaerolineales bacterium HSG6]|nr:helix-turn-helix transcriptional regulator [Anaerolineales bacterium HSG6]
MNRFGGKLRALRKQNGLSQRRLAEMLEVHHSYVGQLELSQIIPNVAMVIKIADIFEVAADPLIRDELELE